MIVVIGGSGLIGSKLVSRLRRRGHEVAAASPASGADTITGEGLAEALAGTQVVVDVANSPSFQDEAVLKFFQSSGRNGLPPVATKATGCQLGEAAVNGRALSTRSCTGQPTSARCPRTKPISCTTRRRAVRPLTRSVTMEERTDSPASCAVCEEEVPLSEAPVREASDYMAHFCGLECYERWRKQAVAFVSSAR